LRHGLLNDPEEVRTIPLGGKVEANPAAGTECATDAFVKTLMVLHPVQRGVRECHVELPREAQTVDIHPNKAQVLAGLGLGCRNHALRGVDAHDMPTRDKGCNPGSERAIAASQIENVLCPLQAQFSDECRPPFPLVH